MAALACVGLGILAIAGPASAQVIFNGATTQQATDDLAAYWVYMGSSGAIVRRYELASGAVTDIFAVPNGYDVDELRVGGGRLAVALRASANDEFGAAKLVVLPAAGGPATELIAVSSADGVATCVGRLELSGMLSDGTVIAGELSGTSFPGGRCGAARYAARLRAFPPNNESFNFIAASSGWIGLAEDSDDVERFVGEIIPWSMDGEWAAYVDSLEFERRIVLRNVLTGAVVGVAGDVGIESFRIWPGGRAFVGYDYRNNESTPRVIPDLARPKKVKNLRRKGGVSEFLPCGDRIVELFTRRRARGGRAKRARVILRDQLGKTVKSLAHMVPRDAWPVTCNASTLIMQKSGFDWPEGADPKSALYAFTLD